MALPKNETGEVRRREVVSSTPEPAESLARSRTRRRMHQLLLTAAAVGTGACEHSIVCDPLPAPISCAANGNMTNQPERIYATAQWTQAASALVARVRITFSLGSRDAVVAFSANPRLTGASLVRVDRQATAIEFDCLPDAGATSVTVVVPMTCSGAGACYRMSMDVRQSQANTHVPFTLVTTGC